MSANNVVVSNGHSKQINPQQQDDGSNSNGIKSKRVWSIKSSAVAADTVNPIRKIVEGLNLTPNKDKQFIPLSIGDPTIFGNFKPHQAIIDAMVKAVQSYQFNGYQPASGHEDARTAVAEYCANYNMNVTFKWIDALKQFRGLEDVILASGCSHSLDLAMAVLAQPGCNMLVPRPGFPLYKTLSTQHGIEIRYYNLLPERDWQIHLEDLESKIDDNTTAIIYNNPSNPCGSVFTLKHILNFLAIAERYRLPVIADEIYEDIVFPGNTFHAIASLTEEVPVLHCSGTTKKFIIPGWRLGWIVINDKKDRFGSSVRDGLNSLSQRIIGSNTLIQGALPEILSSTPKSFFDENISYVADNAMMAYNRLEMVPGLKPIKPSGAFYMMVKIEMDHFTHFSNDLQFVESLVSEESVFCLPGGCFEYAGFVRLVLAISHEMLEEALDRIELFCNRYYV